ncbi:CCA tRNA nucleotidyltransferase [Lachnospiraceae bacterium ZAX-1]
MQIHLPNKVNYIIGKLVQKGYEAYAVGGCIRDSMLGRDPQDWDITTSATPNQIKCVFPKTIDTGIAHGTVTVELDHAYFEVTTYRIDGKYEDGRHPNEVLFTRNLKEDLRRRDFTINAMAYNEQNGLVDIFGGRGDLDKKIIRCVGEAKDRFTEDALRMLRAIRFSAQLGFSIENGTKHAMTCLASNLNKISAERVQAELVKLLLSSNPQKIREVYETGMSAIILPELDQMMATKQNSPHHCYTVGEHCIQSLLYVAPQKVLRLTMLLHDIGKPCCISVDEKGINHFKGHQQKGAQMAKEILKRLKFDNDTIEKATKLILWHDDLPPLDPVAIRQAIYRIGIEQYPALFAVKKADILAKSEYGRMEKLAYLASYEQLYGQIREHQDCLSLKELAVSGKDLIEQGMKPGIKIGQMLEQMLQLVLIHPQYNSKETLLRNRKALEESSKATTCSGFCD